MADNTGNPVPKKTLSHRAAKRELKREKKAQELANEQWHRDYQRAGSPEQQKYVDRLVRDLSGCQASFITYEADMAKWLDPRKAQYDMEIRNMEYCRNMFDYCISPLQHGVSSETVASCLGLYVGMSLFSKDFKNTVKTEVSAALMPVMEKLGERNARVKDRHIERDKRFAESLERITGHKIPILSARAARHESGENMRAHDERAAELRDKVLRGRNHGRLPFTAETAAVQYLNFMHQYYHAIREPDADIEKIDKCMDASIGTLFELCARDNVPPEAMFESVRTVAGHAMTVDPSLQAEFEELGYESYKKSAPTRTTDPVGRCFDVWCGEFEDADGNRLDGPLSVRQPQDVEEHQAAIEDYLREMTDGIESMDDVAMALNSESFQLVQMRFLNMMKGDFQYFDSQDLHNTGKAPTKTRNPADVLGSAIAAVGKEWSEKHPDAAQAYHERLERERIEKRNARSHWGPSEFDPDNGGHGADYDSSLGNDY